MIIDFAEDQPGLDRHFGDGSLRKIDMCIDSGADGGAAQRKGAQVFCEVVEARDGLLDLRSVAAEFLAQPNGGGVLKMSAADLDDLAKCIGLGPQRRLEFLEGWNQSMYDAIQSGKMDGARNNIVARLAFIDM